MTRSVLIQYDNSAWMQTCQCMTEAASFAPAALCCHDHEIYSKSKQPVLLLTGYWACTIKPVS